jgi:hypothetical protein
MKDWVPFFQSLVWPAFAGAILVWAKTPFLSLIKAIEARIVAGADLDVGPTGFSIRVGQAPKIVDAAMAQSDPAAGKQGLAINGAVERDAPNALKPGDMYLVHTARRDRSLDRDGQDYYRIRLYLDADEEGSLDLVSEVTYYLHPTFRQPIVVVGDRRTSFELRTSVWGEFNAAANVRFKDGTNLKLERYLNI